MRKPAQEKYNAVLRVLRSNEPVINVSRDLGVARKTLYCWISRYKNSSPRNKNNNAFAERYVRGDNHPKNYRSRFESKILEEAVRNPQLSVTELSNNLKIGRHALYTTLQENNLSQKSDREAFSRLYKAPGLLHKDVKLSIVKKAINEGQSVSKLAEEYKISRKAIHSWVKRYREEGNLTERYVQGETHPKSLSGEEVKGILGLVINKPEYSLEEMSKVLGISIHGIFNVLRRYGLTYKDSRVNYSKKHASSRFVPNPEVLDRAVSVFDTFTPTLAPAPPPDFSQQVERPKGLGLLKVFSFSFFFSFIASSVFLFWLKLVLQAQSVNSVLGLTFSSVALFVGGIFFLYSLKYYLTMALVLSFSQQEGETLEGTGERKKKGVLDWILSVVSGESKASFKLESSKRNPAGLQANLDHINLTRYPYISVQIPFYNEKNVVERSIAASTNFDYRGEYEVILCDDSTDETTNIIQSYIKSLKHAIKVVENTEDGWILTTVEVREGVTLKHLHRTTRSGFKGGALKLALTLCDPKTEFVSIFDADFVPYPDSLDLFLKYFKLQNGMKENYTNSNVAAVQGYQWHVLNKSENWITRGVRSEYAGSYVIERSGTEIYSGLKQISGSVYMVRRDALESVGWGTSITEDFELTLKLYNAGYKVVYTPYIQAPAECVSTLKRLIRQRMRWSEGHSQNIKRMFFKLLLNPNLKLSEKFELLYLSPYYLQAFFFLFGTLSWLLAETVFQARLPFWTELWGWSLVFTNLFALPLMNATGLFLEESEEKDYMGLLSFLALSYILVPFQAYSAVRGFLEQTEGPWFRTPKSGRITDMFIRGKFLRFIQGILPGRVEAKPNLPVAQISTNYVFNEIESLNFNFKKRMPIHRKLIPIFLIVILVINYVAFFVAPSMNWDNSATYAKELSKLPIGGEIEIKDKRTETTKLYLQKIGNNESQFHYEGSVAPLHYKDSNGVWQDIDLHLHKENRGGIERLVNTANQYQSDFATTSFGDDIATIQRDGLEVKMSVNTNNKVPVQTVQADGQTQIIYPQSYNNMDVVFKIQGTSLIKEFVLKKPESIDSFVFTITLNQGSKAELKNGEIILTHSGKQIFRMPKPKLFEVNPRHGVFPNQGAYYSLEQTSDNTYVIKKILTYEGKAWLNDFSRVYPVAIDATLNLQVNASGNDGDQNQNGLSGSITDATMPIGSFNGNPHLGAARFLNVTIANAATINSATLTLTGDTTYTCATGHTCSTIAYGEAADNSAIFTATNGNMSGRTNTAHNSGAVSIFTIVKDTGYTWDMATAVQDIVNRAGFASGNAVSILVRDNGSTSNEWQNFYSYDENTAKAPKLDINYTNPVPENLTLIFPVALLIPIIFSGKKNESVPGINPIEFREDKKRR